MDFVDQVLVRLAEPATRAGVFDQESLERIASAAYDPSALSFQGPFAPTFDDLRLGVSPGALATVDGTWNPVGGPERTEARFQVAGLAHDGGAPVHALWRGAVVVRFAPGGDPVTDVVVTVPAADGLHADVTFAPRQPVTATPRPLPLAAAILIRGAAGFSLAQLLHDALAARERLAPYGVERPHNGNGLEPRTRLVVICALPATVFDDTDWPGANQAARRTAAGTWLAREGIGLVAVP